MIDLAALILNLTYYINITGKNEKRSMILIKLNDTQNHTGLDSDLTHFKSKTNVLLAIDDDKAHLKGT
jgi:hypothetical protein